MIKTQHQQPNYQNNQPTEDDFDEIWVPNPHGQVQDSAATHGLINSLNPEA